MVEHVVTFVVEKVGKLLINEARFTYGVSHQIEELQEELGQMRCFLKDVYGRQEESATLQNLVIEIRKVTYDAEDVLELFAFKVSSRRRRNVLLRFACIFNEGITIYTVGSKIDRIKIKISKLTASLQSYGIRAVTEGGEGPSSSRERLNQVRRTYSHVIEEDVVGFDKDIKTLVEKLVNQDHRVVSIFGMGGLGKTTLAKKVYHHPDVRRHFDSFAWVCISQMWEKMDVLKGILIKLIPEQMSEIKQMIDAELVRQLYEIQQQKKCLVVLDDIWDYDVWNTLRPAFPDIGDTGSRILLTTRKKEVAFCIDRYGFHHQLGFLNREESWQLLVKKAFPGRRGTEPRVETQMEKKGKEMLERCGDVPLAIVVVGGLLANRHTLNEWEKVHHSLNRYLKKGEGIHPQDQETVQQVLALSYNDLPYQLKSCFLYLGNFQEDYNVSTEKLFLLWITEGMVVPEDRENEETMIDVAKRYLGELAQRSMVQVESSNDEWWQPIWEQEETCRLHDLMRELCLSKRKGEDFQSHGNIHDSSSSSTGITKTRKLAIYFGLLIDLPNLKEFKLLRVLDFEGFNFGGKRIPEGIGKLIHLKYLSFRNCWGEMKLPSSIGNLQFLQILDIRGTDISIPNVLWKLESLRHLYFPFDTIRINEKLTLDGLSRLEILENFDTRTCVLKDLFKLPQLRNLKARVTVGCMEDMETIINYLNATSHQLRSTYLHIRLASQEEELFLVSRKVFTFCNLERLALEGKIGNLPEYRQDHFSANLTRISLRYSGLTEDPMTTLEKLPNLKFLRLEYDAYVGNEMVCSAGGFPQLRSLTLGSLTKLENWQVDEGALLVLSSLTINGCEEMKRLPEGLKFLTNLHFLGIYKMPEAFGDKVRGEDSYIIRHVPLVRIDYELRG